MIKRRTRIVTCKWCDLEMKIRMLPRHLRKKCKKAPKLADSQHICSVCQDPKPKADFPHSQGKPLGIDNRCKACHTKHLNEWKRQVANGERPATTDFRQRPGAWVMKPCPHCGEAFRAREINAHQARCPKKKPNKHAVAKKSPVEIQADRATTKALRAANRKTIEREGNLKSKYGIDMVTYDAMFSAQGGKCAICGLPPLHTHRRNHILHVDHCHATEKIRDLLCDACNHGLGYFRDNPATLLAAIDYLLRHRPIAVVS